MTTSLVPQRDAAQCQGGWVGQMHRLGRHRLHGMLLALRGSLAIISEPARPELGEYIINQTACEGAK